MKMYHRKKDGRKRQNPERISQSFWNGFRNLYGGTDASAVRLQTESTQAETHATVHRLANEGNSDHAIADFTMLSVEIVRQILAERKASYDEAAT